VSESVAFWLTVAIFSMTYVGLALGKLPGLRTDRAGIALAGAAAILACGLLSFDGAVKAVDFATIVLLLGMMVVVVFLRRGGFFLVLTEAALSRVQRPAALLAVTMLLSGALSALLVNDVVCLALTPLVVNLTRRLNLDPKPHLIGLAIASNVGSTATLTGNPQNMIIGGLSQISYLRFAAKLAPVAILGLVLAYIITYLMYHKVLRQTPRVGADARANPNQDARPLHPAHRALLIKSLIVTLSAIILFFAGAPMPIVAIGAAAILLLERIKPDGVYRQIDWSLLVMFAGLFVVVRAFEVHVLSQAEVDKWTAIRDHPVGLLSAVSAALSNLVSNVPAVLLFKSVIPAMPADVQETAWLALAMSSTLAGNLTVLGSVANLIVVENARKHGIAITLAEYCRVGVPVTLLTLLLGVGWLCWSY
jgi:Na+/H+ antiporter NhaD/arsenite permease-like protein